MNFEVMDLSFVILLIAFVISARTSHKMIKLNKQLLKDKKYLMDCLNTARVLYASDVKHDHET